MRITWTGQKPSRFCITVYNLKHNERTIMLDLHSIFCNAFAPARARRRSLTMELDLVDGCDDPDWPLDPLVTRKSLVDMIYMTGMLIGR